MGIAKKNQVNQINQANHSLVVREMLVEEQYMLEDLLYEAIFQHEGAELLPRDIIKTPEISVYVDDFGSKPDDYCLVADLNGKIVGAVWVRILAGEVKGYGNVDDTTPEFAISLFKEYRNRGIGRELMGKMLGYLTEKGYKQTSLSVDKANYAVRLYKAVGFEVIHENEVDYLMLRRL